MSAYVAVAQQNDQPEDEKEYTSELVILEGKQLRVVKYNKKSRVFDYEELTSLANSLGFAVITPWEALDGKAYAVVELRP